ncbi:uncharacterized protein GIQ15_02995 [Arthroderma uncinatum]|uniref:uncharacterized protein n=1 Tax=Arthroderma uncinatum TaxID=74035 RepID=UPI00144ADD6F|nr:uncharacterized protein GIQ15_02995 [Arthroderma uncinatum]KAF3483671.1 hypothetical protein GIQ15_02995 [Arthroderma uncinatum]
MSASFLSGPDGWGKHKFEAYAKILRLKNGGQIEEAVDFTELADEQAEIPDLESTSSVNVDILSRFNEDKLNRAFLDRLSELIAHQKGGYYVSSSLMIEWPDRVDILVARNNGFKEKDPRVQILETIASSLRDISQLNSQGMSYLSLFFYGIKK